MRQHLLHLVVIALAFAAFSCGSPPQESVAIGEKELIEARVAMHGNRACSDSTDNGASFIESLRLKELTFVDASLQIYPDQHGPTINAGDALTNYCWWVPGTDCPTVWYGDEILEFADGAAAAAALASDNLVDRCTQWLQEDAGIDTAEAVAVSIYQDDWAANGYEGFEDGAYPVYICLIPRSLLGNRDIARVKSCTMTILAATESGDQNMVFGHVTSLEFER